MGQGYFVECHEEYEDNPEWWFQFMEVVIIWYLAGALWDSHIILCWYFQSEVCYILITWSMGSCQGVFAYRQRT
uniref:Uncharacterized protein n=1 Tax=Solanum lycopersicum TaxID=4081 RepID=A0A3Q7GPF6_SOLLC